MYINIKKFQQLFMKPGSAGSVLLPPPSLLSSPLSP